MNLFDFWNGIVGGRTNYQAAGPTKPPSLSLELSNTHLERPIVFDPALCPFTAHRAGEPVFQMEVDATLWQSIRMSVLHHALAVISQSQWREHLLLRGSGLMSTWFGSTARRPGDLDWVVMPSEWGIQHYESRKLVEEVLNAIEATAVSDELFIPPRSCILEDIWTYDRVPGLRIVVPWKHSDPKNDGTMQMDFVFGEVIPTSPVSTEVALGGFAPVNLRTASPEQSLAWKLLWLATDSYAMGKDLYDAVLLAEKFGAPTNVIRATFQAAIDSYDVGGIEFTRKSVRELQVDWDEFIKEYPRVNGAVDEWRNRLATAIDPIFVDGFGWYR